MKFFSLHYLLLLAGGITALGFLATPALAQDAGQVQALQRVIEAQQRQNDDQQRQIEAQQKQLDAQRKLLQDLQTQMATLAKDADKEDVTVAAEKPVAKPEVASAKAMSSAAKPGEASSKAPPPAAKTEMASTKASSPDAKNVTSGGGERVKLAISGWVNRSVNVVDDGKDTEAYFVDNDNSDSRIKLTGTAKANDDKLIQTKGAVGHES